LFLVCLTKNPGEGGVACLYLVWPGAIFTYAPDAIFPYDTFLDYFINFIETFEVTSIIVSNFIFLFFSGTLTGWIIGKIKTRKNSESGGDNQ